ncbi:GAF domain-containing protein [Sulfurimonas sp.]
MKKFDEIADFGKRLMTITDMEKALELISDEAKKLVNAKRCSIFIVDNDDEILWTKLSDGIGRIVISLDAGIVGDTYKKRESQIVNNPYENKRFLPTIDKKSGFKTKNMITVPIFDSKRNVMGIFQLLNKERFDFDKNDMETLTFFANYVSGSLELALLRDQ